VCGNEEEVTAESYDGYPTLQYGDFYVCGELPEDGANCPDAEDVVAWQFFEENVGPSSGDDQGYWLEVDCGPEPTRTDACCYVIEHNGDWIAGRPLVRGGVVCRARLRRRGPSWGPVQNAPRARAWAELGLAEHASIASFAVFERELALLGAPAGLIASARRARAEEVLHARLAFSLASRWAGRRLGPGPLRVALPRKVDLLAFTVALAEEGCVAETISAAQVRASIPGAACVAERRALETMARDETRHAALAWETASWLVSTHPHTLGPLREAIARGAGSAADRVGAPSGRSPSMWSGSGALSGARKAAKPQS
jgi:hypothetical protein